MIELLKPSVGKTSWVEPFAGEGVYPSAVITASGQTLGGLAFDQKNLVVRVNSLLSVVPYWNSGSTLHKSISPQ
jgi:hypothetical protein